jgi:hypothetical protein
LRLGSGVYIRLRIVGGRLGLLTNQLLCHRATPAFVRRLCHFLRVLSPLPYPWHPSQTVGAGGWT